MRSLPKLAWMLGYAGLIPFFILTLAVVFDFHLPFLSGARVDWWLVAYAAVIVSFLGAIYWGIVLVSPRLTDEESRVYLSYGVLPSILAWLTFLLPIRGALVAMGLLILLAYTVDAFLLFPRLGSDYAKLRLHLSVAALVMLFIAAISS